MTRWGMMIIKVESSIKSSMSRKVFLMVTYIFLIISALICVAPLIHVLAVSLSSGAAAAAGKVKFLPVDFTWAAYQFVIAKPEFLKAFGISLQRVVIGTLINMVLIILTAYPLSKETTTFRQRSFYVWFIFVPSLFSAGLIPTYIVVQMTGLIDTIWSLILPGAVQVFNIVLLLNFFRALPKELEEAAFLDGAGHWTVLTKIFLPISKPSLATITLFVLVGHWNTWFDGMIYMNMPEHYPLQTYLRTIISPDASGLTAGISSIDEALFQNVNDATSKAAQIFVGALPILAAYPFLQKYFTAGMTLGSVKG